MFQGSLPSDALKIVCKIFKSWNVDDVYVGCSGNFTIERCLRHITTARLHSNDVTVYSCLLGRYFSGKPLNVKLKDSYTGVMRFVEQYLDEGAGTIAVMLILSKMGLCLSSKPNAYYERMINAYIDQFERLWLETKEKIEKVEPFISEFHEGDVYDWVDTMPSDSGFISFPPFWAGGYEKMFRVIDEILDWSPPQYEILTKDRMHEMFTKLAEREYFMFGAKDYLIEFKTYLVGMCKTSNLGVPIYFYAKSKESAVLLPRQKVEPLIMPRIGVKEDIGNEIKLITLGAEQFQALRSHYLNPHIKPGQAMAALGVVVDNKLIGVYAFSIPSSLISLGKYIDLLNVYLLSDFSVSPTKYTRLAKLVLYAALSKESKAIAESLMGKRIYSVATTAFSKNPISMKYRGLFRLLVKKKVDDAQGEYTLTYGAEMGQWTLNEGLKLWKEKHGKEVIE